METIRRADANGVKSRAAILVAVLSAGLALAPSALAVPEQGDAGDTPSTAQDLTTQVVDSISGTFAGADSDLFRVCLSGGGSFSASTVGVTDPGTNTQLFLFDAAGMGIYADDDAAGTEQSTLPAGHPLTPAAAGEYLLGVSPYDRDPQSAAGAIFNNVPYLVGADGRGAAAPVERWWGGLRASGAYTVSLTGTRACESVPPTIDLRSPADGAQVPLGAGVEVDFSCADAGGSGVASCVGSTPDGEPLDTSSIGPQSVTVTARDGAGNETTETATVEVVDAGAPTISLRTPADGAEYSVGDELIADYECLDEPGGSAVASCTGDLADGAALDTSSPGAYTFTVTATDAAGNSGSTTASYTISDGGYDFGGFLWPVRDFPAVNRWPAGLPVPIRFSLGGYHGRDVLEGWPRVAEVECGAGETPADGHPARSPWGKGLRYKPRRDRYVFWWKTSRDWRGSCRQFLLKLDDGSLHRAEFRFTRLHWWGVWTH